MLEAPVHRATLHSAYLAIPTVLRSFEVLKRSRAALPQYLVLRRCTAAAIHTENAREKELKTVETRRADKLATNTAAEHLLDHLVAKLERGKHRDQQKELWCSCDTTARRRAGAAVQYYTIQTCRTPC